MSFRLLRQDKADQVRPASLHRGSGVTKRSALGACEFLAGGAEFIREADDRRAVPVFLARLVEPQFEPDCPTVELLKMARRIVFLHLPEITPHQSPQRESDRRAGEKDE